MDMALHVDDLIQRFVAWARGRAEIRAVVLVGSHARGMARPDSDVDLVILSVRPEMLLIDHAWIRTFGTVLRETREDWGQLQSIRVWYDHGPEVEFGVTHVEWAAPNDESTLAVLRDGSRVLMDHDGVFGFLEKT
jgi:predicted nucleotidyltransferase